MITAGVDLSSQAASTAACVIEWTGGRGTVADLRLGVVDEAIVELAATVDKLGIDVPVGWPTAFAEAIAEHSRSGKWPPEYRHADTSAFRLRRTDLWLWKALGMPQPLSVSTDRIALPAMRAASLLSGLPDRTPLDGSGVIVEVYPAVALRRWGHSSRGYKGPGKLEVRRILVTSFLAETEDWLNVGGQQVDLCTRSDDAFDALVASLVARAVALDRVEPIPLEDREAASREGWIAVPLAGSLELLGNPAGI